MPAENINTDSPENSTGGDQSAWVQAAQARLAAGGQLDNSGQWDPARGKFGIPASYKVDGDQLVHSSLQGSAWDNIWPVLAGFGGVFGGSFLNGLGGAAGSAAPEFAVSSAPLTGVTIPTVTGAVSGAASGAAAGAAGAAGGIGAAGSGIGSVATGVGGSGVGGAAGVGGTAAGVGGVANGATANAKAAGLPDWLKNAQDIGSALSSASAGRAAGRVAEGTANQNQARAAVDLYNTELGAPARIARNAVKGDILANAQDVNIDAPSTIPVPKISGGLRPSMFSPATRATGTAITNNARDSANNLTPLTPPTLPPLPEAGALDSFLNTGSSIANVAGSVPWDKIPWAKIAGAF